ncbi:MAG: LPS export ABC transporter periplasmic protein LptC [Kangiella sp.]|nr:MAG: LPS export ABC transporter periplasmic protein LptC [Kangiella sp.]
MDRVKLNRWLIAFVAIAMLFLVFDQDEKKIHIEIDSDHPEADYTMENIIITQYASKGAQNHQLTAKKMIHYNRQINDQKTQESSSDSSTEDNLFDSEKTRLDSEVSILIEPTITYKNQQSFWTLSAKQGRMTNQQSKLFLVEQVELIEQLETGLLTDNVRNRLGSTKVTTVDLEIDLITKIAHTDQEVILQAQNITASSHGMKIDMENSKITLLSDVRTQLTHLK